MPNKTCEEISSNKQKYLPVAMAAGLISATAFSSELWHVVKTKKPSTIDSTILEILIASNALWLFYAYQTTENALGFFSMFSFLVYSTLLLSKHLFI